MIPFRKEPGAIRRGLVAFAAGLLALPAVASAEVRLQSGKGGEQRVQVRPTERGVWSPVGRVDAGVLNPQGDLVADAAPSLSGGAVALAAWHRPGRHSIRVARGQGGTWQVLADLQTPGPVGTPLLAERGGEAIVAWTIHGGEPITRVAWASEGEAPVLELSGAVAIDVWFSADDLLLAAWEAHGVDGGEIVIHVIINPIEEPVLARSIVLDAGLDLAAASSTRRAELRSERSAGVDVLGWWATPSTLRVVAVAEGEVLLPLREFAGRGAHGFSPSIWNEALRELRKDLD